MTWVGLDPKSAKLSFSNRLKASRKQHGTTLEGGAAAFDHMERGMRQIVRLVTLGVQRLTLLVMLSPFVHVSKTKRCPTSCNLEP